MAKTDKFNIPIILGTARKGRQSEKAANFVLGEAIKYGFESELIDVRDYLIRATDNMGSSNGAKKLSQKIASADGLIIVSPEYNHGYPGELKLMLDMLYEEYQHKPLGICGISAGALGGARMVEQLRLVGVELRMAPIRGALYFREAQNLFDDNGKMKDISAYAEPVKAFFDELSWYAGALKNEREKLK